MRFCEKAQLRVTPARELILAYLAAQPKPVKLEAITQADQVRGRCDPATVYRTLMLLKDIDLVRQIPLPGKSSFSS